MSKLKEAEAWAKAEAKVKAARAVWKAWEARAEAKAKAAKAAWEAAKAKDARMEYPPSNR